MKINQLLLIASVCLSNSSLGICQTLTKEVNNYSDGDISEKKEVQYISPGNSGKDIIWDYSDLSVIDDDYHEDFTCIEDSVICRESPFSVYKYKTIDNSVFCLGYNTRNLQIHYLLPELCITYPFEYLDSISSYFYGEGKYSHKLPTKVFGKATHTADATGRLILPDNNTLNNVIRIHDRKIIAQDMSSFPNTSYKDSCSAWLQDSIICHLSNDSIKWQVDSYKWYAPNLKFPIIETMQTYILYNNKPIRHYRSSYYSAPQLQPTITEDLRNEKIRKRTEDNKTAEQANKSESGRNGTNKDLKYNYYFTDGGNSLVVKVGLNTENTLRIQLSTLQGVVLERTPLIKENNGAYCITFDMQKAPMGIYILTFFTDDSIISTNLLKKN